jgi:hypothetical protein
VFSDGPGRLSITLQSGQLVPSWDFSPGAVLDNATLASPVSLAPASVVVLTGQPFTPRPFGTGYDFIGVPNGFPIFDIPQAVSPGEPFISIGADTLVPGDWSSFSVSVSAVLAPPGGEFSVYTDTLPNPIVLFATSDGINALDSFTPVLGGHSHHTFAFTQTGLYEVTFDWNGTHTTLGPKSAQATTYWGVTVIPEPSTNAACLGALALGATVWHRRRVAPPRT